MADGKGEIRLDEIEVGGPGPGEVLVRVVASGVCHTDHQILHEGFEGILGHEAAGVVEAVGDGVGGLAPGDHVVSNWALFCGECVQCRDGRDNLCEVYNPVIAGFGSAGHAAPERTTTGMGARTPLVRAFHVGSLSTYTVMRAPGLIRIPDDVSLTSVCMVGCGVATGFCSVSNAAAMHKGATVVVLGCGGVGLGAVQAARIGGAARIVAVDLSPERLDVAERVGATDVLQSSRDDHGLLDASEQVKAMLGGRGADYAFECTAVPALGAAPLAMVHNGGTAVQVSGIEEDLTIDMRLFEWDKTYLNPLYGACHPAQDLPRLVELYRRGELFLDELVAATYALDDIERAIDDMLAGAPGKCVVVMDEA